MLFCSPGDKETKLCVWEAGSVPPGGIEALGVQLLSQPPLAPGEQELGRPSLLPWIGIFPRVLPFSLGGFSTCLFSLPVSRSVLIPCASVPRGRSSLGLLLSRCVGRRMAEMQDHFFVKLDYLCMSLSVCAII